jgi:triosephosphate isomerase (TIM)
MKTPLLVVNFKTYPSASGEKALEMAKIHAKVAREKGITIAIAVQAVDLKMIAGEVNIPVLAQHFDLSDEGPFTGHITPHSIKSTGAFGSLLNHSERRLSLDDIEESLDLARRLGLYTIACADSVYSGKAISALDPNMIAIEPPELIGGDVSVCTAQPQLIPDAVNMIGKNKVLVGAGIKTKEDVLHAMRGGAGGVLVSSGVVKSLDPEKVLNEMADGLLGGK